MSQLTLKKTALFQRIQRSDFLLFFGFCFAACGMRGSVLLYPGLAFFYQRSRREWLIASAGALIGSISAGFAGFYCQLLLITFMLLLICLIQLVKQNLFAWFPAICGLNVLLGTLAIGQTLTRGLIAGAAGIILCRAAQSDWMWIDPQFKLSEMMLGILLAGTSFAAVQLLPVRFAWPAVILILALTVMLLKPADFLILAGCLLISLPVPESLWMWGAALVLLNAVQDQPHWVRFLCWMGPLIWSDQRPENLLAGVIFFALSQLFPAQELRNTFVSEPRQSLNVQRIETRKRTILHQLGQFSRIFDLIADYYETTQPTEARFLEGMSRALDTVSMQMKQSVADDEAVSDKLVNLLEGYHFEVKRVHVQQWDDGPLQITIDFAQLTKAELEEVVMPIIHMVIDKDLKVTRFQRNRIFYSGSRLELSTSQPSQLKTRLYTLKVDPEVSGDTGAVFRNGQTTICTISDGMGTGSDAGRASQFVTQVLQRMLSASMPVEAAVQSINALLHADQREQFATLDFLCYDHRTHKAYLSKSGACPTYLVRMDQVMEISGESLPIGIIQEIESDCFQIDCQDDDLFIMSSDGVEKQTLDQWIAGCAADQIVGKIEAGLKAMEQTGCEDDVTVLLARVGKC